MSYVGNTPTQQAFTPVIDYFSGNGSTTAFTLSRPVASVAQVQAVISNVPQEPGVAFTVSGSTITFTSAPPSGSNNIYVYYTSPITQVIAPSPLTVTQSTVASGVAGTGPAFYGTGTNSQSISNNTFTQLQIAATAIDTNSRFNTTGSTVNGIPAYSFLPNVAGYYLVSGGVQYYTLGAVASQVIVGVYKNGAIYNYISNMPSASGSLPMPGGTALVYLNGTSDYVGLYTYQNTGSSVTVSAITYFQAALVRAA